MIRVTKLNNSPMIVNIDAIKFIEATPDTVIYFINGESLVIRESVEVVEERVFDFKVKVTKRAWELQEADQALRAKASADPEVHS